MAVIDVTINEGGPGPDGSMVALEDEVARVAGVRNAADGALVALAVDALDRDLWRGWRIHTPVQWLMWRAGLSRATARQVIRVAVRATELPTTMALVRDGRLSLDQAAVIARHVPASYEASVCEMAVHATVAQIRTATRRYDFDVEAPERNGRPTQREMAFGTDEDGQWWARIRLAADEGKLVEEALMATRDHLHDAARAAAKARAETERRPTSGTDAQLGAPRIGWADAIVGMAHAVLDRGPGGAETTTRAAVHLHLEHPTPGCGETWRAELHDGPALPSWLRRYLLCDCDIDVVWTDGGIPVTTSRAQRTPSRRIRRLVERRDHHRCRVPGCDQALWLQVHHIIHWEDDGETVTWNICCLCGHHHRLHHQGLLGIAGNADKPDGLTFTTQHGLVLDPAGRARPPTPEDLPSTTPYDGPTGERLHQHDIHFSRRSAA